VIIKYTIKNNGAATLNNLYVGLFADWDIMDFAQNRASWDPANNLGYVYSSQVNGLYGGIKLLTSGAPAYWAIDNDQNVAGTPWGIYDDYTDAEKYQSLSSGIGRTDAGGLVGTGEDVSHVVGTGPFTLGIGNTIVVAFAIIAGDNLSDIVSSAIAADVKYSQIIGVNEVKFDKGIALFPNPAPGVFTINVSGSWVNSIIEIYNLVGKKVIQFDMKNNSRQIIDMSGFSNGVYFVRINTQSGMIFKKVLLF